MTKKDKKSVDEIMKEINKEWGADIIHYGVSQTDYSRIPFTSPRLNYITHGGIPRGRLNEFYGTEGGGKALVNGTPVLCDGGWVSIEKLSVGDKVFGEDGKLHTVIGVYPQGIKPCYEITLRDRCKIQCSADHLWSVYTHGQMQHLKHRNCKLNIKTTEEIASTFLSKGYFLPSISAMDFSDNVPLLLDPYLLGLMLGDGGFTTNSLTFSNTEEDLINQVSDIVAKYDCSLQYHTGSTCQYHIKGVNKSKLNPIKQILKQYNLLGKHSNEKFIPIDYKYTSIANRYKIIAGLINTDGSVYRDVDFSSTSKQLVIDLWEICMGLGINCTYSLFDNYGTVNIPNASITDELFSLFSTKHKLRHSKYLSNMVQSKHKYYRKIINVQSIGSRECTCIKVDNPSSLFITKDFIPTHNTTHALDIVANYQIMEDSKTVLWLDAERTLDLVWANKLNVNVDDMLLLNPETQGAEALFEKTLRLIDTGEIGFVVIDSLGIMLSDQAYEKTVEDKTYGGISMALTRFSKEAVPLCAKNDCTLIGINQIRADMNSQYGALTTTGGKAWRHNCSCRLEFRKGSLFDSKYTKLSRGAENPVGHYVDVYMAKNKTCASDRLNGFDTIRYDIGIDYLYDLTEVCMKYDVIEKSGSWYSLNDVETGEELKKLQGQYQVSEFLGAEENVNILKMYEEFIDAKIKEN